MIYKKEREKMKINTEKNQEKTIGEIEIAKNVIAQIAHQSVMETYGFVGFGYKERGILEMFKGENVVKGVNITEKEDNSIEIEIYVVVQYGVNINMVAKNCVEKIIYNIEKMTTLKVSDVIINVQGVRVR